MERHGMICLHHNDLDGRCAAAIVKMRYPDAECVEVDYASDISFDRLHGEGIIIVDFSLQRLGDWEKLIDVAKHITWIDHHESAIKKAAGTLAEKLPGIRDLSKCGALLCWQYFVGQPSPWVVGIIDAWDRWIHNDLEEVLNFVSGMKIEDQSPGSQTWKTLLDYGGNLDLAREARLLTDKILQNGATIRAYETKENEEIVGRYSYPVMLDGHHCLACNSNRRNSKVFDSVPTVDRPEIFIAYVHDGKNYTVSLYSTTVKVNDIAVAYGGGGHPGAAGFVCKQLPWAEPPILVMEVKSTLTDESRQELEKVIGGWRNPRLYKAPGMLPIIDEEKP